MRATLFLFLVACGGSSTDKADATADAPSSTLGDCDASAAQWISTGKSTPGWACGACKTDVSGPSPQCTSGSLTCKSGTPTYCPCGFSGIPTRCCDPNVDGGGPFTTFECDVNAHEWKCPAGTVACN